MPIGQRVVLIGGGHNALITAFYLAKGGFKPLLLERREMVGGGAVTEEFHPGFRASTLAHTVGPLRPVPGWAYYRTPIDNLYMCGSATHPGGGIMGAPGRIASQVILKEWKKASAPPRSTKTAAISHSRVETPPPSPPPAVSVTPPLVEPVAPLAPVAGPEGDHSAVAPKLDKN